MAKRTSKRNSTTLNGTNANDTLTVKHTKITVNGLKGVDTINITKGSSHKVYGGAGNDKITAGKSVGTGSKIYGDDAKSKLSGNDKFTINGGKKNYFYGGKGTDTFTVNAGSSNYLYGGAGVDTFVIGKNSTGTATVKDFAASDKVKVTGNTSNIYATKNNIIINGGKSGKAALTLVNAKGKKFTVTDSRGSYAVNSANIALKLAKYFKGTLTAPSFITTIDARTLAYEKNNYGSDIQRDVNVTGNAKANTIYVANINGGTYQGGAGKDNIKITSGNNHIIYADNKTAIPKVTDTNTITVKGGTGHKIFGGAGIDIITVEKDIKDTQYTIDGGNGNDEIKLNSGGGVYHKPTVNGGAGDDKIYLYNTVKEYFTVNGGTGNDTIDIYGGNKHNINGGDGVDRITLFDGAGTGITVNGGTSKDYIVAKAGAGTINGDDGDDEITLQDKAKNFVVNGGDGKDKITVNAGTGYKINAGKGDDTIIFNDGAGNGDIYGKIYGGQGNDSITLSGGNNHYVYGDDETGINDGNDTITINAGSGHKIYAGRGTNTIKLNNVSSSVNCGDGTDTITVNSGTHTLYGGDGRNTYDIHEGKVTINGGSGVDTINVYGGTIQNVNAGGDKDIITLSGGQGSMSYTINGGAGEDTIKVTGGNSFRLNGGNDKDTITVSAGSNHRIDNDGGDDIITIKSSAGDNIKIYGCDSANETVNIEGGDYHRIELKDGNDTILVTKGNSHKIYGGVGNDTITVTGGQNTYIESGGGDDAIAFNGGEGHVLKLTNNGTNTINVASKNVTITENEGNSKDKITVAWSDKIGTLTINSARYSSSLYKDELKITGATLSDFTFEKSGSNNLTLVGSNGCGIEIKNWNYYKSFSDGITFSNTTVSFADINKKAGFTN